MADAEPNGNVDIEGAGDVSVGGNVVGRDSITNTTTSITEGGPVTRYAVAGVIGIAALALVILGLIAFRGESQAPPNATHPPLSTNTPFPTTTFPPPTATIPQWTATPAPTVGPFLVEPAGEGKQMILLAGLEAVNTDERNVTRFIVDDLTQRLQEQVPFSNLVIREYPAIITTKRAALEAAIANQAAIVIWGNYAADFIQLEVQIGDTSLFAHNQFAREVLERTANVRVQLRDERQQSIARQVLGSMIVLYAADGNSYEALRALAIQAAIEVPAADIISGGVAGQLHKYSVAYISDPDRAFEEINDAIALDGGNPLLYAFRASIRHRLGAFDEAARDAETAQRLGPPDWVYPLVLRASGEYFRGNFSEALAGYDQVLALRPNDWWLLYVQGALFFLQGDLKSAQANFDHAIALQPTANFPYGASALIALHEGRILDTQGYLTLIFQKFPDPTYAEQLIKAYIGKGGVNPIVYVLSAFGKLTLAQYDEAIAIAEIGIKTTPSVADFYFIKGVGLCNLKQLADAEAAYTQGLKLDPSFTLLHLLRVDVRLRQQNLKGVAEDVAMVQASPQAEALASYLQAAQSGKLTCENLFTSTP